MNDRSLGPCFHCGLPTPAASHWRITIDGVSHPLCCPGCEAVATSIARHGLGDFYRQRDHYAAPVEVAPAPAPAGLAAPVEGDTSLLSVESLRCAACVWLIEARLRAVAGVAEADLNLTTSLLRVRWRAGQGDLEAVRAALAAIGYPCYPYDSARHGAVLEAQRRQMFKRLFVAGLSMMQVMMYVVPFYLGDAEAGAIEPAMVALLRQAACVLTLPAVLYSAAPFWRGAWRSVRAGMPGMDVPVALGIGAAFGASVVALWRGQGGVYFDAVTMFIFLLLASQYLELRARCAAAMLLQRLRHALPPAALLLDGWPALRHPTSVAASRLRPGDAILVPSGAAVAADGIIIDGATDMVLAQLTGEPMPQARVVGDTVPGGAVNSGAAVVLRVTRAAGESTMARLAALVEQAGQGKPAIALWADRVGAYFVVALLLLAAASLAWWYPSGPAHAWQVAVAVLVVSCPCALSLATPAALAAATGQLLARGVLVVQPHVLETLQRATHVVFDKTGTLTEGTPQLTAIDPLAELDAAACLALAAALESGSAHPLARALLAAAGGVPVLPVTLIEHAGAGVAAMIHGQAWRLGNAAFAGVGDALAAAPRDGASCLYLAREGQLVARFTMRDRVRVDAAATIAAFRRRGVEVIIVSGDAEGAVAAVAAQLGVRAYLSAQLPAQKLAALVALQATGAVVAVVGDGINDAAVLRAADVSFAMGKGSDLACLHADCVLLTDRLASLQLCLATAGHAIAVIRQNLLWATLYNAGAIPLAACGLLQPWMAAVGMSASSALVVLNALRLRRAGR